MKLHNFIIICACALVACACHQGKATDEAARQERDSLQRVIDGKDAELDDLIMQARQSTDQTYRKTLYKACLDTIVDWATEVPVYQRQNAIIFSTERVNIDTIAKDQTPYWTYKSELNNLELN